MFGIAHSAPFCSHKKTASGVSPSSARMSAAEISNEDSTAPASSDAIAILTIVDMSRNTRHPLRFGAPGGRRLIRWRGPVYTGSALC